MNCAPSVVGRVTGGGGTGVTTGGGEGAPQEADTTRVLRKGGAQQKPPFDDIAFAWLGGSTLDPGGSGGYG